VNPEDDKLRKLLHERFDGVLEEPIPVRMYLRPPRWKEFARAAVFVLVGLLVGLAIPYARKEPSKAGLAAAYALPASAARAHVVYASEVLHPVEVAAAEQDHLVRWLSKRLDVKLKVPVLSEVGYELMGGRLLPGIDGPVAQFMFQDAAQKRVTVYVTNRQHKDPITAFRYIQEGPVSVFYWVDDECGYAIAGELGRPELTRIATLIYKQLEN
jgi:anti-sigma factor RsiW